MSTVTTRTRASGRAGTEQVPDNGPPGGPPDGGDGDGGPPAGPGQDGEQGLNEGNPLAAIPFALVPAQATQGVIDYRRAEGVKTFQNATRSVYHDSSESFNCDQDGLWDFMQLVEQRCNMMGIKTIFQVPHRDTPFAEPVALDFLSNHGRITRQETQVHAASYVATMTRDAQDSTMLYHMLWNSLSAAGRTKVGVKSDQFTIGQLPAGVPFLKVIIEDSGVETHATVSNIRNQLAALDEYMVSVDSDVKKFNIQVKTLIRGLRNHGQMSTDLLIHLFKGYKAAKDDEFNRFIKHKEELYEEGDDMDAESLMEKAEGKYKILLNRGEWKASPQSDKRILALEAKIRNLEKTGNSTTKSPGKDKKENPKAPPKANKKREIADWMKATPKSGEENKPKKVDGKEYWWCTALQRWCQHKPVDCRALKQNKEKKFTGKKDQKKLKFAKALEAIDGHDDDESDSE